MEFEFEGATAEGGVGNCVAILLLKRLLSEATREREEPRVEEVKVGERGRGAEPPEVFEMFERSSLGTGRRCPTVLELPAKEERRGVSFADYRRSRTGHGAGRTWVVWEKREGEKRGRTDQFLAQIYRQAGSNVHEGH